MYDNLIYGDGEKLNILISGATGSLGSGVADLLAPKHNVSLTDVVKLNSSLPFYQVDIREEGALDSASTDADVIIHTPAFHGIHMGINSEKEFYDLNVTGTFQMFQSAIRNKVRRIVWLSSMSFYRNDFYAYTKKIGEQLCQFYHDKHGLEVIMLRPSDFTPFRDIRQYGERLLHGGVDRRDVITAVLMAVECKITFGAYHIVRDDPFTEDDILAYSDSPIEVMEKVYPGSKEIIKNYKITLPTQIHRTDLRREKEELGYHPQYNFGTFIKDNTKKGMILD
jgi:nucleoside-diphosphate-sugar epimerase